MSIRILVDMNLSVEWIAELAKHGWSATHWSAVGDPRAEDTALVEWALDNPGFRRWLGCFRIAFARLSLKTQRF
jgi:hypothetical protein